MSNFYQVLRPDLKQPRLEQADRKGRSQHSPTRTHKPDVGLSSARKTNNHRPAGRIEKLDEPDSDSCMRTAVVPDVQWEPSSQYREDFSPVTPTQKIVKSKGVPQKEVVESHKPREFPSRESTQESSCHEFVWRPHLKECDGIESVQDVPLIAANVHLVNLKRDCFDDEYSLIGQSRNRDIADAACVDSDDESMYTSMDRQSHSDIKVIAPLHPKGPTRIAISVSSPDEPILGYSNLANSNSSQSARVKASSGNTNTDDKDFTVLTNNLSSHLMELNLESFDQASDQVQDVDFRQEFKAQHTMSKKTHGHNIISMHPQFHACLDEDSLENGGGSLFHKGVTPTKPRDNRAGRHDTSREFYRRSVDDCEKARNEHDRKVEPHDSQLLHNDSDDDEEENEFEVDELDDFNDYIPQSLALADPDSLDVITVQDYDEATVVDEEAFRGDLWASLHGTQGGPLSKDASNNETGRKYSKYRKLLDSSTQRPNHLNPHLRHEWNASSSNLDCVTTTAYKKNKDMYSKIDARLEQITTGNQRGLDALSRDLEQLRTSTHFPPSKQPNKEEFELKKL